MLLLPEALLSLIVLGFFGAGAYLVLRYVIGAGRGDPALGKGSHLEEKVLQLENTIESMQQEIARLSEAQQFTTRLLTERAGGRETSDPAVRGD